MKMILSHIGKAACLLTSLLFIPAMSVKAQDPQGLTPEMLLPQFSNLSPEAASLGKFGTYNVSEYSGSPNIRIPLFTIQSGDVSIPVELYYDASGIKVEQDATFVGLGWNLSYGGCISHIVCGDDDYKEENPFPMPQHFFDNYISSMPKNNSLSFPLHAYRYATRMRTSAGGNVMALCDPVDRDDYHLHEGMTRGFYVPDIFEASFCGQHVSFIIDKKDNNKIVIVSNNSKKYKIEYVEGTSYAHYPSTIKITDDKGITYQFEGFAEFDYSSPDSYYLTKVYGPDGVSGKSAITYEYESLNCYSGIRNSRNGYREIYTVGKLIDEGFYTGMTDLEPYTDPFLFSVVYADNDPRQKVYPSKITTATETVTFSRQSRSDLDGVYAISGIQVKSKSGTNTDKVSFSYGYFEEDNSSSNIHGYTRKRLKLNSVTVNSKKYQMEYDGSKLPLFDSTSKDYWGYYNGVGNTKNLCGTPKFMVENNAVSIVEYLGDANRYASESLCKVGMLKKITYPTGGYTTFEFEANHFDDQYYYPDASKTQTLKPTTVTDYELNVYGAYGPRTQSTTFSIGKEGLYQFRATLSTTNGTTDVSTVTLKNASTGKVIKEATVSNGNLLYETYDVMLPKGNYTMEATITIKATGYTTTANCVLLHEEMSATADPGEAKGGASVGGGLRIKSVKNYDSSGSFLNGTEYEYRGGKLLKPTVKVEWLNLDFSYVSDYGHGDERLPRMTYIYTNAEPSYLHACSVDVPATVGYSKVIRKEVDGSNKVVRKTELEFHNCGYETVEPINKLTRNYMYHFSNGHLNGKVKSETVYSENGKKQYRTDYTYDIAEQTSVVFQKCVPSFFHGLFVQRIQYDVALFYKYVTLCYLSKKNETFYDINGSNPWSRQTDFTYDSSNYQVSEQTVSDGLNTQKTKYWYPSTSGNKSAGLSNLTSKNCLSEVTAIDQYRNSKYIGGSRYDYTANNNLPVVSKCYSILPNSNLVTQMTVTGYDGKGNIREYKLQDGTPVTIIGSYNRQHPVLEIVGSTYTEVKGKAAAVTNLESASSVSYDTLKSVYNSIKTGLPNAHVTAYMYSPWHGVSRIIAPNGHDVTYSYDNSGRLEKIGDPQGITQKYQYNYKIK